MKNIRLLFVGLAGLLCALSGAASVRLTLEQCVDSALARNPALNAAALEVERARILQGTAFDAPKTEVTLKQETTGGGGPENGVFFGQEFDFPTLYVARGRALSAATRLEESRYARLLSEVQREVGAAYGNLAYCNHLRNLYSSLDSLYGEFCRVASVRLSEGEAGQLEMMNAERVRESNRMEMSRLELEYAAGMAELKRLTGIGMDFEVDGGGFDPLPLPQHGGFDFGTTLRGLQADRAVEVANREVTVAKNEFLPGIRLGATVQALIKGFNPYHIERERFRQGNFMGFEVGVTVPLFFGASSSRLKAADAERRIALLNREAARAEAEGEYEKLAGSLAALYSRIEYFRSVALPRAREIERIAKVSYELGDIDYMEYIGNVETAYGVYRDYADCVKEYNLAVIAVGDLVR